MSIEYNKPGPLDISMQLSSRCFYCKTFHTKNSHLDWTPLFHETPVTKEIKESYQLNYLVSNRWTPVFVYKPEYYSKNSFSFQSATIIGSAPFRFDANFLRDFVSLGIHQICIICMISSEWRKFELISCHPSDRNSQRMSILPAASVRILCWLY